MSTFKPPLRPELKELARQLRAGQTDAEHIVWGLLRNRRFGGFKFRRQHPVDPYVLDFYCEARRLAIELDGGQHNTPEARQHDERRKEFLNAQGVRVLRFWNFEVLEDTECVLEAIWNALHAEEPSPPAPLPQGEGSEIS